MINVRQDHMVIKVNKNTISNQRRRSAISTEVKKPRIRLGESKKALGSNAMSLFCTPAKESFVSNVLNHSETFFLFQTVFRDHLKMLNLQNIILENSCTMHSIMRKNYSSAKCVPVYGHCSGKCCSISVNVYLLSHLDKCYLTTVNATKLLFKCQCRSMIVTFIMNIIKVYQDKNMHC